MSEFLKRYIDVRPGVILDSAGKHIGIHEGAALYTRGQRHGFTIEGAVGSVPHYITHIDTHANTITVSTTPSDAATNSVMLSDIHWVSEAPAADTALTAQVRYHAQPVTVQLSLTTTGALVTFAEPQIISPGQAVVIYVDDVCQGGGVACA
jgi:tRNA-specific 2-thiouridylase